MAMLMTLLLINQFDVHAASTNKINDIKVKYNNIKNVIVATQDWVDVAIELNIANLKAGNTEILKLDSSKYTFSNASFTIGDELQIIPDSTQGIWTLKALKNLDTSTVNLNLKLRFNENIDAALVDQPTFCLGTSNKTFSINVTPFLDKVSTRELVRKVPLGFTKEKKIAWVIYFNYNQAGLIGTSEVPFQFKDVVGPHQKLDPNSISVYDTNTPILEVSGSSTRNLRHDEYNYSASRYFQKYSKADGIFISDPKFKGVPDLNGGNLSNRRAYYIYLETIPEEKWLFDTEFTNYTYMRISYEGIHAWEDEDMAKVSLNENSTGDFLGKVILKKVDANNAKKLEGAQFTLKSSEGKVIKEELETNENGEIVLSDLENGGYSFIETRPPNGYKLDASPVNFYVDSSKKREVHVIKENEKATIAMTEKTHKTHKTHKASHQVSRAENLAKADHKTDKPKFQSTKPVKLPRTGEKSSFLLMFLGVFCVMGSICLFVNKNQNNIVNYWG